MTTTRGYLEGTNPYSSWDADGAYDRPGARRAGGRRAIGWIVLLAIVAGGFFAYTEILNPAIDLNGYAAGKIGVWQASDHGRFRALFPTQPKFSLESVPGTDGALSMTLAVSEGRDGGVGVAYADFPAGFAGLSGAQLDRVLRGGADGATSSVHGRLLSARFSTVGSRRSIHFRIQKGDSIIDGEGFLVGARFYLLQVEAVGGSPRAFARLKSSFHVIGRAV